MYRLPSILTFVPEQPAISDVFDIEAVRQARVSLGDNLTNWALSIARRSLQHHLTQVARSRREIFEPIIGATTESISLNVLRYLCEEPGVAAPRVSRAQRHSIAHGVRESIDLARQTAGLRRLERDWKQELTELTLAHFSGRDAVAPLHEIDERLSTYFDKLIDENARFFGEEQQRLFEHQIIGQRKLVEGIIAGRQISAAKVNEVLGITSFDVHYGFIIESTAEAELLAPTLDLTLLRRTFERVFQGRLITLIPGDAERIWAFASGSELSEGQLRLKSASLTERLPGCMISVGQPGHGLEGIRTTHLTALAAHRVNTHLPTSGPAVHFTEHGLLSLALGDTDLAVWFVRNEIGPLLTDSPFHEELRTTLLALLEHGGAHIKVAESLFVHRNTISHRLRRLEELLGRDPLSRPLETHAALRICQALQHETIGREES